MTSFSHRPHTSPRLLRQIIVPALLFLPLAFAACDRMGAGGVEDAAGDSSGVGGLSQEELEKEAQSMTAEQAKQAGVADSTEAAPPSPVAPADTVRRPPAPADTVRRPPAP